MNFDLLIKLISYFVIGATLDVLIVIDFKATQNNQAFKAASVSFLSGVISFIVFYFIITTPGNMERPIQAIIEIITYCFGGSVGSYFMIKKGYK